MGSPPRIGNGDFIAYENGEAESKLVITAAPLTAKAEIKIGHLSVELDLDDDHLFRMYEWLRSLFYPEKNNG